MERINEVLYDALRGVVDHELECSCKTHLLECDGQCWYSVAVNALAEADIARDESLLERAAHEIMDGVKGLARE